MRKVLKNQEHCSAFLSKYQHSRDDIFRKLYLLHMHYAGAHIYPEDDIYTYTDAF